MSCVSWWPSFTSKRQFPRALTGRSCSPAGQVVPENAHVRCQPSSRCPCRHLPFHPPVSLWQGRVPVRVGGIVHPPWPCFSARPMPSLQPVLLAVRTISILLNFRMVLAFWMWHHQSVAVHSSTYFQQERYAY